MLSVKSLTQVCSLNEILFKNQVKHLESDLHFSNLQNIVYKEQNKTNKTKQHQQKT